MKIAAVIRVWCGNSLLILKRPDKDRNKKGWCLPGGKQDKDEQISNTAFRELLEETGFSAKALQYIGKYESDIKDKPALVHVFEIFVDEMPTITISSEHVGFAWVDKADLGNYDLSGKTQFAINL